MLDNLCEILNKYRSLLQTALVQTDCQKLDSGLIYLMLW